MSVRQLPDRPSLEHLKKQAKALVKGFRAGESAAVDRVAAQRRDGQAVPGDLNLSLAQEIIALEYGFTTWADLRRHVEPAS